MANYLYGRNSCVPILRTDTHIDVGNSYISSSIKWIQFSLTLAWACKIHNAQRLSLPISFINLELEKQKPFRSGQIYLALNIVTNIKGLYLTGTFRKDATKANKEALNEYDRLQKEALFTPVSSRMFLLETLSFILFNIKSLKRHAVDIDYDKNLIANDILFLTEALVRQSDNLSAMQSILGEYTLDHNISSLDILALPFVTKAPFLFHFIRKMVGFHFSTFLSKHIFEKLLVWYWSIRNILKVLHYFMKS